jgi:oligoendopeptidase F
LDATDLGRRPRQGVEREPCGSRRPRERSLAFLRSGSSDYPVELLRRAGVDMGSPEPVRAALRVFARLVEELEGLIG